MTIGHDERHTLLEELDLLRARRREIEASLEVDDHPHDVGEQAEATERRDELDWIDRRIRDIVHLLWSPARATPRRTGSGRDRGAAPLPGRARRDRDGDRHTG